MTIKILGGELKGLPLFVPKTLNTRPTSVLLKRRLFDSYQNLTGFYFYDVCAGTGAIGFEALSRGAESVTWIEPSYVAFKTLQRNIRQINDHQCLSKSHVQRLKFEQWIAPFQQKYVEQSLEQQKATIVFFDPPYEQHNLYRDFIDCFFIKPSWFKGQIWVESDSHKGPAKSFFENFNPFLIKKFQQGTRIIYIFSIN